MVQLTLNGKGDLKKIKIDKSLLDPAEVEVLEDLIVAAFNDARGKVSAHAEQRNAQADRRSAACRAASSCRSDRTAARAKRTECPNSTR